MVRPPDFVRGKAGCATSKAAVSDLAAFHGAFVGQREMDNRDDVLLRSAQHRNLSRAPISAARPRSMRWRSDLPAAFVGRA